MPLRTRSRLEEYLLSLASSSIRRQVALDDEHEALVEAARVEAEKLRMVSVVSRK